MLDYAENYTKCFEEDKKRGVGSIEFSGYSVLT